MLIKLTLLLVLLLFVLLIGTPVSFGLGFVGIMGIVADSSFSQLAQVASVAYNQGTSINLLVAPLFILMAEILSQAGVAADLFLVLGKWLRKVRGGLAVSATVSCMIFAALCGSSPAAAATIGRISIHQMVEHGYDGGFAAGVVCAGGTLALMIPPSVAMVIYGILTETSIAKLFVAGIVPGLLLGILIIVYISVVSRIRPEIVGFRVKEYSPGLPTTESAHDGWWNDVRLVAPLMVLVLILLAMLYTGFASPTEIAGFGSVAALLLVAFLGRFRLRTLHTILVRTARVSAMIAFMIFGGMTLSYVVSYLGLPQMLATWVVSSGVNRWVFLLLVYLIWLILGCLIDPTSMIVLTIPFLFPAFVAFGFDPIWLGVVSTLAVQIGMVTPPVGLNLFILRAVSDVPMGKIISGSLPFVVVLIVGLVVLTVCPQIALYLPLRM